ncbi:MAG: phosphatase PAP2 family protein [Candidatus Lokiarchaeota archaeon]|nr:phosphatase PAP2 family protein [Candidatus Lokiarchaeota archaeon]MBD3202246.1 phosphatase PAP2 family protein [Candidatus Lokiarchaeota archaeon]
MRFEWNKNNVMSLGIILLVLWIILAILFGIYDLEISIFLANNESIPGNIGKYYGEAPGYGLIGISIAILIGSISINPNKQKLGAVFPIFIGTIYLIIGISGSNVKAVIDGSGTLISILIFLVLFFKKDWRDYRNLAWIIFLIFILNVLLFVQSFKFFWGRVRFYNLNMDYSNYTPWYLPRGPTGNLSFPSGHASVSFMLIPLLIPIVKSESKKIVKLVFSTLIIGWALFIAISRVLIGAHYASDILFSSAFACFLTLLLYILIYEREKFNM